MRGCFEEGRVRSRTRCASCVTQASSPCTQALGHGLLCLSPCPCPRPAHWPRSRQTPSGAGWVSKNGDCARIDAPGRTNQMRARGPRHPPTLCRAVVPRVAPNLLAFYARAAFHSSLHLGRIGGSRPVFKLRFQPHLEWLAGRVAAC